MHSFAKILLLLGLFVSPAHAQMTAFPQDSDVENLAGFAVKSLPPIEDSSEGTTEDLRVAFEELTPEQKARFFNNRHWILSGFAQLMRAGKFVVGTGIRMRDDRGGALVIGENVSFETLDPSIAGLNFSLGELGRPAAEGFLNSVNTLIWQKFRVFGDANEKGLALLGAGGVGLGFRGANRLVNAVRSRLNGKRPYLVFGMIFHVGANWRNRELFIELSTHHETLREVHTMVTEAYVGIKPTPFVRHMVPGEEMKVRHGKGYYGGMFGSVIANESYVTAGITYCAGYPTFPWGGAAVMETDWTEVPMFRFSLFPTSLKFMGWKDAFSSRLKDYIKRKVYEYKNPGQCRTRV